MGWTGRPVKPPPPGGYVTKHRVEVSKDQSSENIKGAHAPKNRVNALYPGGIIRQRGTSSLPVSRAATGYRHFSNGSNDSQFCPVEDCGQFDKGYSYPVYYPNVTDAVCQAPINALHSDHGYQYQQQSHVSDGGSYVPISTPGSNCPMGLPVFLFPSNNEFVVQYHHPFEHIAHQPPLPWQNDVTYPTGYPGYSSFVENGDSKAKISMPSLKEQDFDEQSHNLATANNSSIGASDSPMHGGRILRAASSHTNCMYNELIKDAISYSKSVFPNLGKQFYCVPPIDRSRRPDKASRLLVTRMESEKRVLGSFEQYFASKNLPVVMLCYYPIHGFLYYRLDEPLVVDKGKLKTSSKSPGQGVITLILLSSHFPVTIVTVNIVNGNSDFTFIQRTMYKAVSHSKQCIHFVHQWLNIMGIKASTKEVIAFPNLKKSIMQRVQANNRSFSTMTTLLMDDLSAPFDEEWSTPVHKLHFTDWMESHVMIMEKDLSVDDLHKVVGTMCCPQISTFESSLVENADDGIENTNRSNSNSQTQSQEMCQLKLTIDGVTKGFDEYMEDYVSCYFPNLDTQTYRVPPVHFNIQAHEQLNEDLFFSNDEDLHREGGKETNPDDKNNQQVPFMPSYKSYVYSLYRNSTTKDRNSENEKGGYASKIDGCCNGVYGVNQLDQSASSSSKDEMRTKKTVDAKTEARLKIAMEDVNVLSRTMTKDLRADEGESRVMNAFESLGKKHGPMFIICSYQYNNYLNKLREEMFSKAETTRPVRAFGQRMRAQHDCLILHKIYGAIIVCIKAIGDNFAEWGASEEDKTNSTINIIKKALKQLDREEAMVLHVTSDLAGPIRCHKLIALPNMLRADVARALSCAPDLLKKINAISGDLGVDAFLCQDELPSQFYSFWNTTDASVNGQLYHWWERICTKMMGTGELDSKNYHQIVGRYCGLLSTVEVWTQTSPRVEVRSTSEAATECSQRFSKILLLPEQVSILQMDHPRLFLHGPPGSGKTMLLSLKAREWLSKGFKVIWLNVRTGFEGYPFAFGVESRLRALLHKLKLPQSNFLRMDFNLVEFESKSLAHLLPSNRVIIDEVSPSSHVIIEHLCNLHLDRIWCASIREEHCPVTATGFLSCQLKKILRCPPTIQNLMKELESKIYTRPSPIDEELMDNIHKLGMSFVNNCPNNLGMSFVNNCPNNLEDGHNVCLVPLSSDTAHNDNESAHRCEEKIITLNTKLDFSHYSSGLESYSLATDGPQPIIIDHQGHGLPMECDQCGQVLAKHLNVLFQNFKTPPVKNSLLKKNKLFRKNPNNTITTKEFKTGKNHSQYNIIGNNLRWSDGLIVARHVDANCSLVKTLKKCSINIEVVVESAANRRLEDPAENKLFFTMCHEATGVERCVVVFVPTLRPDQMEGEHDKGEQGTGIDLRLQTCLARFHEDDKRALWHMASRTLSTLILILP